MPSLVLPSAYVILHLLGFSPLNHVPLYVSQFLYFIMLFICQERALSALFDNYASIVEIVIVISSSTSSKILTVSSEVKSEILFSIAKCLIW